MPDIEFLNSPRIEQERLDFTRKIVRQGFYQKHGFVVLPELEPRVNPNAMVVFPRELNYQLVDVRRYQREWEKVGGDFWQELERDFPGVSSDHGKIEVRVTRYGTVSSGATIGNHEADKVVYYLRSDVDMSHLAAMIINKILHSERKGLGITWSKRETLMDFIMTRPVMKKIFPKFHPIMNQLSRVPASIRKQSEQYLRELGILSTKDEFDIAKSNLSVLEKKVMKLLTEHQGELVSYDELADSVWGVGEFKTFWAINKLIERMRNKLEKIGFDGARVMVVRGQGYLLK